ncbi:choline ABC transporter, periplasmic binding protein [compost metagenome]
MKRSIAAFACAVFLLGNAGAAEQDTCRNVRMGVVNWTDVIATSAIADALLQGLGYQVKQTRAAQQIIFSGLRDDRLDVFLGYWSPLMDNNIRPFVEKRQVRVLDQPSLPDAQATLAVPDYAYAGGLRTFADIAKYQDQLDGKIYGIEPGTGANKGINRMIAENRFGLGQFRLVESGEAGMLTAVRRAIKRQDWIVFFGWKPHPMNLDIRLNYLSGSEGVYGPNEGRATVSVVTATGYAQRCPNIDRLLHNLTFTAEQESHLMAPIMAREEPQKVARDWLKAHPEDLERWLDGVTTFDGQDGRAAVRNSLNQASD